MKKSLVLILFITSIYTASAQKIPKVLKGEWETQYVLFNPLESSFKTESPWYKINLLIDKQNITIQTFDTQEKTIGTYVLQTVQASEKFVGELTASSPNNKLQIRYQKENEISLSINQQEYLLKKKEKGQFFDDLPTFEITSEEDYINWWKTYEQILQQEPLEKRNEILGLQEGGLFLPTQTYSAWQIIEETFLSLGLHPIKSWSNLLEGLKQYAYPESISQILRIHTQNNQVNWTHYIWTYKYSKNTNNYTEQISFQADSISFSFQIDESDINLSQRISYPFSIKSGSEDNTGQLLIETFQDNAQVIVSIPYKFSIETEILILYEGQIFESIEKTNNGPIFLPPTKQKKYHSR